MDDWVHWRPEYANASRPGLLEDGSGGDKIISMSQLSYPPPHAPKEPRGPRRELLKKFFMYEYSKKHLVEMTKAEESDEMSTEYKAEFQKDGFEVRNPAETADPQLLEKYPIYTDPAKSIYLDKIRTIKGTTASKDPSSAFKRCSYFSRPFYAELE